MRLIWSIAVLIAFGYAATKEPEKTCFFSIARPSPFEKYARKGAMKVSDGEKCSGNLVGMDKLKIKRAGAEYHGAFHDLDVCMSRGAGHYMSNANDMTGIPADLHVCEHHLKELGTRWGVITYNHINYDRKKPGHNIISCSWPVEEHNFHIDRKGDAHYLSREETKKYLIATGIHLHLGLPLCKEHYDVVLNAGEEAKEEQCDPSYMDVDEEEEKELLNLMETELQKTFFAFCKEADVDHVCPRKTFDEYTKDTQTRKARTAEKLLWTILKLLAPGFEKELFKRLSWNQQCDWEQLLNEKAGDMLKEISRQYLMAEDSRSRYIILSQAAASLTYPEILPYFPGLSSYKYNKARRIARSLENPPEVTITRQRWDVEMIEEFVFYIASPHNMVNIPSKDRTATLSTGETIDIPDVIRIHGNTEIIRQYKKYMMERGKLHLVMSDSSMMRILNALPATKRHSMTCVDTFKAAAYETFEDIKNMIEEIKNFGMMSKQEGTDWLFRWMEIRHYLKTDFGLHVKHDSRVADHSMIYALSDPDHPEFAVQATHPHDLQCPRCNHIVNTFREFESHLKTLSTSYPSNERALAEMAFRLNNHKETIEALKAHVLRSVYTDLEKERIIEELEDGEALITADYGQKVLPCKHYEDQCSYFGKKGMSWHFSHVLAKVYGTLVQHAIVHIMEEDDKQDSMAVVTTIEMTLRELYTMGIHSVDIRSDNAGYYHCSGTLGSMIALSKSTGVRVKSWSFSEQQNGKGPSDRCTGNCKSKYRRQINSGKSMMNQQDLFDLLTTEPLLKGVSVHLFKLMPHPNPATKTSKIPRVTDYSHFEYGEDSVRAWKYRGIGEGVVFTELHSNEGMLPAYYWHYDPSIKQDDVEDEAQEAENHAEDENPKEKDYKGFEKGLLFACECGANFLRHENLLNHLEFGKHQSHPWKITSIDLSLKYYQRCLEDVIQVKSLIPLQDVIEKVFDKSIPLLPQGWALRSVKKSAPLPQKAKELIQAFFLERTKINQRAGHEEAYRRMVADPSISLEERLTKEQVKRYINRLVATPVKKTVVARGKRSTEMEIDEDGDAIEWKIEEIEEVGEWEVDAKCEGEEGGLSDQGDVFWEYIIKNKKALDFDV